MSKPGRRLYFSDDSESSPGEYPDYSEHGLPDGALFEGDIFPVTASRKTGSVPNVRSIFGNYTPGDAEELLDYSEHGLPASEKTYDQIAFPWLGDPAQEPKEEGKPAARTHLATRPPDISDGIGQNQVKKDLASLAEYIKEHATWRVHADALYQYNGRYWDKHNKLSAIRAIKELFLGHDEVWRSLGERDYKELYDRLLTDPLLLCRDRFVSPTNMLNLADGTLDISQSPPRRMDFDPNDGFLSVLDLTYDEVLNPPMRGECFETFVADVSEGNPIVRRQLLELTAITLTGLQLKCLYVILGPTDSGKSQWGRFLLELLGPEYVGTVRDADDFGDKWTVGSLAGKRLGLCMDLPDHPLSKAAIGILKQFCGADPVKAELKYVNSFTYYEKPLMLLAGNHPIHIPNADQEEAFLNRMIIIPFSASIPKGEKVQDFYIRLLDEAPYIVHEAILAYQDLADRCFELTRAEVPQRYRPQEGRSLYGSIKDFAAQALVEVEGSELATSEIYDLFCAVGSQVDISLTAFSKVFPQVLERLMPSATAVKRVGKTEMRGYKNIAFASSLEPLDDF